MTLALTMPLPTSRRRSVDCLRSRRRRDRRTREQINRDCVARLKADVEPSRITLTIGCHIIGWFPSATPLAEILGHLVRWADAPGDPLPLPWPQSSSSEWWWSRGEQVAVWHDSRILAVVALGCDGRPVVTRLDSPAT